MRVRLKVDRLQQLLAQSRLSQNHWALRVGVSRGHWSALVNGKHLYPSPKTRHRMLEVFGVAMDELFQVESGPAAWYDTDFRAALHERYLIDRELGQGAMGSVYLARDLARGRLVAIKVLEPEAVSGIGTASFLREVSFVARLQHPNILPLFDSGVAAEHPYFVMPWIRGGSLRDRLRRETRLAYTTAIRIVRQVAAAIDYAHSEHVLHCDIKPANILLHDDHPYVMDFGISRVLHAEASEWRARNTLDVSAGTPAYVSPEQANGELDVDARADVYSLGCVTYELLTGRAPFEGDSTDAIVAQRFFAPPPSIRLYAPEVPGAVVDVVKQSMEIARERRPATPGALARMLDHASVAGNPIVMRASLAATRASNAIFHRSNRRNAYTFGGSQVQQLLQDARLTMRSLRRSWRFALAFVLPLALGLGAGATFFSVIDHVLYRAPLGVVEPGSILQFGKTWGSGRDPFATGNLGSAWIDVLALREASTSLSWVAATTTWNPSLGRGEGARVIAGQFATASFFPLVGVKPQLGRFYNEVEDQADATMVPCVASDRLWRTELGADPSALGRTLTVGRLECSIVGVLPQGFNGLGFTHIDIWAPLRAGAWTEQGTYPELWTTDQSHWLRIFGRLKPGATLVQAKEDGRRAYISHSDRARDPEMKETMVTESIQTARASVNLSRMRVARWLTSGAAALILLVCANLINLLVARNLSRVRETAIRLALGGGWTRLFRYYFLECATLSLLGGAASLVVVQWAGPIVRNTLFPGVSWADGTLSVRVVAVALSAGLVLGGIVAAITALSAARLDPALLLSGGAGPRTTATRRGSHVRFSLVAFQAALSVALLVASVGFIRSFHSAANADIGFKVEGLIQAQVDARTLDTSLVRQRDLYARLHERVSVLPGVAHAALGYMSPWWNNRNEQLHIPGRDSLPLVPNFGSPAMDAVTPDYLATMQMRLLHGRFFSSDDVEGSPPVLVVNEALARLYWPDEDVLGKCLIVGPRTNPCREIVGVVGNHSFRGGLDDEKVAAYFVPWSQSAGYRIVGSLFVRAAGDAESLLPSIRQVVQGFEPNLPAASVRLVQTQLDPLLASWRLGATAFTALGAVAVVIALAGLFSVLAYLVAERRREFAIRGALGAKRSQILEPVLRQSLLVVVMGCAAGLFAAFMVARWVQPLLFHVRLLEPWVLLSVTVLFIMVTLLAAFIPARSASRTDLMEVLRD